MSKKFSVSMDESLVDTLDALAKERYMSRSGVINLAVRDYIAKEQAYSLLGDIKLLIEKASSDDKFSEEDKQVLKDFETASNIAFKYKMG